MTHVAVILEVAPDLLVLDPDPEAEVEADADHHHILNVAGLDRIVGRDPEARLDLHLNQDPDLDPILVLVLDLDPDQILKTQ